MTTLVCLLLLASSDGRVDTVRTADNAAPREYGFSIGVLAGGGALLQRGEAAGTTSATISVKPWRHVALEAAYQHVFDAPRQFTGGAADLNLVLAGVAGSWGDVLGPILLGRAGFADGKGGVSPAFSLAAGLQLQHGALLARVLMQSTLADACFSNLLDSFGCTKLTPTPGVVAELGARF